MKNKREELLKMRAQALLGGGEERIVSPHKGKINCP